ncbi:MAG: PQQ-binding-like beta-propeller repeat protein [Dehalococcoidia bacterium]
MVAAPTGAGRKGLHGLSTLRGTASALAIVLLLLPSLAACTVSRKQAARPLSPLAPDCSSAARIAAPSATGQRGNLPTWPVAQHDARHSSSTSVFGPQRGNERWTRRLEGPINAGPVVGPDGTVYVASTGGVLHALDPTTGADRWSFDGGGRYAERDASTSAAVLAGGIILWPGPHNSLFALDAAGHLLWSKAFDSLLLSPAIDTDDSVFIVETNGHLHALDITAQGATERWVSDLGTHDRSSGSPAIGDGGVIYATVGNRMVAMEDLGDHAQVLWHFDVASGTEVSPAVGHDGMVIFGTNDDFEYGLSRDGHEAWRYPRNSLSFSSPAVTDGGLAYFGDHNGYMNVVQSQTGCLVSRYQGGGEVWTSPAIDGKGDVYFGTKAGHILGFGLAGQPLFDIDTGAIIASYPALAADGTLLIGSTSGILYAFHD